MPVELRPATENDAAPIAMIWEAGWRDGHLGNVPDELAALRTADTFRTRAAEHVGDTTVAQIDGQVAGFVMVIGDGWNSPLRDATPQRHRYSGMPPLREAGRMTGATENRRVDPLHGGSVLSVGDVEVGLCGPVAADGA